MLLSTMWFLAAVAAAIGLTVVLRARETRRHMAQSLRLQQHAALRFPGALLTTVRVYEGTLGAWSLLLRGGRAGVLARGDQLLRLGWFGNDGSVQIIELTARELRVRRWPAWELSFPIPRTLELIHPSGHAHVAVVDARGKPIPLALQGLADWLQPRVREVLPPQPAPSTTGLKWALMSPVLLAIGGIYLLLTLPRADSGPFAVAARADGLIAAASERRLYLLDPAGGLIARELSELGFGGPITQLAFSPEGELHLSDRALRRIRRCDVDLRTCPPLPGPDQPPFYGTFRFTFTPDGQALVASNNLSGALVLMRRDGEIIRRFEKPTTGLCMPNGLTFGHDGNLYVADSDHLRISEYSLSGNQLSLIRHYDMRDEPSHRCMPGGDNLAPIRSLPGIRPDRGRPVALAQDAGGRWWTTLSNMTNEPAEIVIFDENWKQPRPLSLAESIDSLALQPLGDRMLLADTGRLGLVWVDGGLSAQPHANAAFDLAMAGAARERFQSSLIRWATVLLALSPMLLGLLLSLRRTRAALQRMS